MEKLTYSGIKISLQEQKILREICLEKNSKEIAKELKIQVYRVNGVKERLRKKLKVKSAIGLVMWAIQNKIVII